MDTPTRPATPQDSRPIEVVTLRHPVKRATLTTCYERTGLKDGRVEMLKLWLLLPRCGDGERTFLGVASPMGVSGVVDVVDAAEATRRAESAGYRVEVQS